MVTLSLHILAARWTGISLQNRKSRSCVTLIYVWHAITFDWHVETSAWTFHLFIHNLEVTVLNKLIRGKALSAAAVPRWAGCVVSYMICKTLEHTTAIINSADVTTVNVSMSTKGTVNWVCVRLGNAYFDTQISPRNQHWCLHSFWLQRLHLTGENIRWSHWMQQHNSLLTYKNVVFSINFCKQFIMIFFSLMKQCDNVMSKKRPVLCRTEHNKLFILASCVSH